MLLHRMLGNDFVLTSITKPGAPIAEILHAYISMRENLTSLDSVIILGSHDSHPMTLQSYLYYALLHIKHTNIIINPIFKNRHARVALVLRTNLRLNGS